jgi:tetratricopeptide (TPR) repeat protein
LYYRGELSKSIAVFEDSIAPARDAGADTAVQNALLNIANSRWGMQDLDGALDAAREAVVEIRKSRSFGRKLHLMYALVNLFGILVERGDLDEAQPLAGEAYSLIRDRGSGWAALDHFALYAAKRGHAQVAARVLGYTSAATRAQKTAREVAEERAFESAMAFVQQSLSEDTLAKLLAQGAKLTDEEACRLAEE